MHSVTKMKTNTSSTILLIALCWCILLVSCRGDEVVYPTLGTQVTEEERSGGLYILCEGNMGSNKARLDYMNLATGTYYANWYGGQNPTQMKELGDVGNDIQSYGNRLYAVINCSHKVEVMDQQAHHIGKIDIPNCRYMAFYKDKMYVSAYVGSVANPELLGAVYEIDTASMRITREVQVGHQPDELCIIGDKLYVCNSGGYLMNRYDSTISVIDLNTMTETEQIPVGLNPTRLKADASGRLWVGCQGNYMQIPPQVVVVNETKVEKRFSIPCANMCIHGEKVYVLDAIHKRIVTIDLQSYAEAVLPISLSAYENPYGLFVTDGGVYATDAKNYVSSGELYCYNHDGGERWHCATGDIPGHLCFVAGEYSQW